MKISSHVSAFSLKVKESHLITVRIQREKEIVKYGIEFPVPYRHVPSDYNEFVRPLTSVLLICCSVGYGSQKDSMREKRKDSKEQN